MNARKAVAIAAALALCSAPDAASPHGHDGHRAFLGGPGLIFGIGAAIAAGLAADACLRYVPIYDADGAEIGRRPVNIC